MATDGLPGGGKACGTCGNRTEPADGWRHWRNLGWVFCNIRCSRRAANKVIAVDELRSIPWLQEPLASRAAIPKR